MKNGEGITPFMMMARYAPLNTIEICMNLGADPNICDKLGRNACMHATWYGNTEVEEYLNSKTKVCEQSETSGAPPLNVEFEHISNPFLADAPAAPDRVLDSDVSDRKQVSLL